MAPTAAEMRRQLSSLVRHLNPLRTGMKYPVRKSLNSMNWVPNRRFWSNISVWAQRCHYGRFMCDSFILTWRDGSDGMVWSSGFRCRCQNWCILELNSQLTPTATARRQLSNLARPLAHHAQGPNIPFGESLTSISMHKLTSERICSIRYTQYV